MPTSGTISSNNAMNLVQNQQATSVIVLPKDINHLQQQAIDDFVQTIEKSTSARIPVIESAKTSPSSETTRIIIGPSSLTESLGFEDDLKPEEFRIHTKDSDLIILAKDRIHDGPAKNIWGDKPSEDTRVTQWALGYLLDRYVGVRWLWPGELGTHIPQHDTITIPLLNVRFQQPLERRSFNVVESNDENLRWLSYHHFGGRRVNYYFSHSFRKNQDNGDWWTDFYESRPDMLAQSPKGKPEPPIKEGFYKLCISNPDVTEEIIRRWEADGMPDFRDITPNDGNGFCACDNCRALDKEYGDVEYTKEEVWQRPDHVILTDRYVWFWNQLITKMSEKNPRVKVGIYLYSAYRTPPKKLKVAKGVVGEMVHGFDFSPWKAWQEAGVEEIGLRPNWLYMGACGPHLPLSTVGDYIEQARANGMILINMDCFHEYWATQGPYYYLIGRLVSRPDLDTATILSEYCSAFGDAAPAIRDYLDYWEEYHERVVYNIPAGGSVRVDPNGLYGKASHEHFGSIMHPLRGHWKTLPYIYTKEVTDNAREILARADQLASDETTTKRIDFLRDGLTMVALAANYMTAHNAEDEKQMATAIEQLATFGQDMKTKHGYWHSKDIFFLKYWGLIGDEYEMSSGQ